VTHVLLDTNLDSGKDIRHWLGRWGMTMGLCDPRDPDFQWPTILQCDLMIINAGEAEDYYSGLPVTGESLAPIILLGVSGSLLLARDAWQVLPQNNPDPKKLRVAVQKCMEQTAVMRHGPASGQDREDFLSFLGHEMRSPLTAAKTALEVLQGDLGGVGCQDEGNNPHLKMLEIALRNVRRLHHTVEWSQEMMASSPVQQNILVRDFESRQLRPVLEKTLPCRWHTDALNLRVQTDGDSLSMLLDQVARALQYAFDECDPELEISCSTEHQGALSLTLFPARGSVQDRAPRVSRLGLNSSSEDQSAAADLERLISFVVSRILVSSLGVELDVVKTEADKPGIRILVPASETAGTDQTSVGQLLTPA